MESVYIRTAVGPIIGTAVTLKTARRKVPVSNPGRACRLNRSEFSVVFSETRVNWARIPLKDAPYSPRSHKRTIGLQPTTNYVALVLIFSSDGVH